jgi:hypothetical protein
LLKTGAMDLVVFRPPASGRWGRMSLRGPAGLMEGKTDGSDASTLGFGLSWRGTSAR